MSMVLAASAVALLAVGNPQNATQSVAGLATPEIRAQGVQILERPALLEVQEADLVTALVTLQERSGVSLGFTPSLLPSRSVNCMCENATVAEALERLLFNTTLGYAVAGRRILIEPDRPPTAPATRILAPAAGRPHLARRASTSVRDVTAVARPANEHEIGRQGTIRGTVADARTVEPVAGVQVHLPGTQVGTLTDDNGRYVLLNVPVGEVSVRVRRIGYRPAERTITVVAGEAVTLDFQISQEALALDAVVVTGTPGETQRRALGNALARVDAAAVYEIAPVVDMGQLLNARVPGIVVMSQAGTAGEGAQLVIRGPSSLVQYDPISAPNFAGNPVLYVDGIRVNNNPVTGAGAVLGGDGGQAPMGISRLNDFHPADIESVEVIRGPAAATLYGSEASSGVIQIITKSGRPGPATVNMRARQGASWFNNAEGRIPLTYWRDPLTGVVDSVNVVRAERELGNQLFRTGRVQGYGLSVSGGAEGIGYYIGVNHDREEGAVPTNVNRRFTATSSLRLLVGETFSATANFGLIVGKVSTYPREYIRAIYSMQPEQRDTPHRGFGIPPDVTAATNDVWQDVNRYRGGISLQHRPRSWLSQRLAVGLDLTNQRSVLLRPYVSDQYAVFYSPVARLGSTQIERTSADYATVDYSTSITAPVGARVESETSFGLQYYRRYEEFEGLLGRQFPGPGVTTVSGAAIRSGEEFQIENTTVGLFLQQRFSHQDRLFLTGAVRADDNSAFGSEFSLAIYPKISASWVVSEEPFWSVRAIEALKLRAAYGMTGQQPAAFAALRSYAPAAGPGDRAVGTPQDPGNPDLGPERGQELEIGFEAAALADRLIIDFTYYHQTTKDAILQRQVPPSEGFIGQQFINAAEVRNQGFEVQLHGRPVATPRLAWDLSMSLSRNDNEVVSLGQDGVEFIPMGWIPNRHQPGYPVSSFFARRIVSADLDADGRPINVLCDGGNARQPVPCADAPEVFVGAPHHKTEGAVGSTFTLFNRFRLYTLFDFKFGAKMLDGQRIACRFGDRGHEVNVFPERFPAEEVAECALGLSFMGTSWIHDAGYVKFREISATYTFPDHWVRQFGASRGSLTLAARNLRTWTNYRGLDPETMTTSNHLGGNHDQFRLPLPMHFMMTLNVTL